MSHFPDLFRQSVQTLQVNLGYRCNLTCVHCHVGAGPYRKENMDGPTADAVLDCVRAMRPRTLDLTGGAPEINPHFRRLVREVRALGVEVIDRCNLTVLEEPDQTDLADFLAAHDVTVVASLPCYLEDNVDAQRGQGTFESSMRGLRRLNDLGYGKSGTGLLLNLVYNPQGPVLPPEQVSLEAAYKVRLREDHGIVFDNLLVLANMPIERFGTILAAKGELDDYMALLKAAHRSENLDAVMCRTMVSVDWQGTVYDCDFNQMLDLPLQWNGHERLHVRDLSTLDLNGAPIVVADHCYGCTAGQGSSCGGALA